MRIDVADLLRRQPCLPQRTLHCQLRTNAVGGRLCDVVRVSRQAIAAHLRAVIEESRVISVSRCGGQLHKCAQLHSFLA